MRKEPIFLSCKKRHLFWVSVGCLCLTLPLVAQQPTRNDLKKLEDQIAKQKQTQLKTKQKADELDNELKSVRKKIVQSAKKVQEKEAQLSELDVQYQDLEAEKAKIKKDLSLTDGQIVQLATGIQTLALRPKEAAFLQIKKPVDLIRSGILMKHSLPVVSSLNETLKTDLQRLSQTEEKLSVKITQIKEVTEELSQTHSKLNKLADQKKLLQQQYLNDYAAAKKKANALAAEAKDLRDLITKLEAEKKRQLALKIKQEQERKAREAQAQQRKTGGVSVKLAQPKTKQPVYIGAKDGSFAKSYGSLPFPASGTVIQRFGTTTISGGHTKGMIIATRAGAQVITPFDGLVLFAGPFKNYRQLLIIDNGDNYVTLLAGMSSINVSVGQELVAGEPVAQMDTTNKNLYVEIRKQGIAIDPHPWFARK